MHTLIIQDQDASELLRVQIKAIDPATATIAILGALAKIEPEKKKRSDAGRNRQPRLELPHVANGNGGAS